MKPVRLLIFDLDGTIADTLEDITASLNFALTKLGRPPVPLASVRRFVGDGLDALLLRALGDRAEFLDDARGIYTVHHSRHQGDRSRLYPGVAGTLRFYGAIPLALVSNKTLDFVQPLLDRLGIGGTFRVVIGADSGLPLKPAPDALLRILKDLDVPPAAAAMVGDGTTDVRAGRAAGVTTCAVTYGYRSEEELRQAGPDHVVHAMTDITRIFMPT
jgi:phosphoglycolate phosphatase